MIIDNWDTFSHSIVFKMHSLKSINSVQKCDLLFQSAASAGHVETPKNSANFAVHIKLNDLLHFIARI